MAYIYRKKLKVVKGIKFLFDLDGVDHNYSYFPILINQNEFGKNRDAIYKEFKKNNIFTRRYFYPLISQFPTYRSLPSASADNLPIANKIANQVICLPIYPTLEKKNIYIITKIIKKY